MPLLPLVPERRLCRPSASLTFSGAVTAIRALVEMWLYLSGSPRSRLRQAEALHDLDDWLRRDIGLPRRREAQVDPWLGQGW
jgi:hypothetical protein